MPRRDVRVRSVLAVFSIYVLAVLLAGTVPVSAGDAMHGGALLHPAFPHVHVNATPYSARAADRVRLAPSFDTSAGGATESAGDALTPPLPRISMAVLPFADEPLVALSRPIPPQRFDPPPDRPPTSSVSNT